MLVCVKDNEGIIQNTKKMITNIPQEKVLTVDKCFGLWALISNGKKRKDEQHLEENNKQMESTTGTNRPFSFSVGRLNGFSANYHILHTCCSWTQMSRLCHSYSSLSVEVGCCQKPH